MFLGLVILVISWFTGCLGAILGLGGGVILIPILTLGFGIHIRYAIGASIVSVIATSSASAARYVRDHLTNVRLAIFLEIATTLGATTGVFLSSWVNPKVLYLVFSFALFQSTYLMWKRGKNLKHKSVQAHPWATRFKLNSSYPDGATGKEVHYSVAQVPLGFGYMYGAGILSGMLGIGSGILKVIAMDTAMGLPIKVSSATSNFMMGVTAAASAGAYYMRGDIVPELAAPVAIGILAGAWSGSKLLMKMPAQKVRSLFVFILSVLAVQMCLKGLGLYG